MLFSSPWVSVVRNQYVREAMVTQDTKCGR